ncbi:hypothetical protein ALO_07703 [Acetonema longum DSM 6540]|uniref:Uncharacterized protein n=1 Tax=Acetonema longum DSM 6540 TaxID=1009370 RepID=F7NHJ3_9FIRM|nr:hypothetical protein ALO_07703 [Acetonema longum DSM 6540]
MRRHTHSRQNPYAVDIVLLVGTAAEAPYDPLTDLAANNSDTSASLVINARSGINNLQIFSGPTGSADFFLYAGSFKFG